MLKSVLIWLSVSVGVVKWEEDSAGKREWASDSYNFITGTPCAHTHTWDILNMGTCRRGLQFDSFMILRWLTDDRDENLGLDRKCSWMGLGLRRVACEPCKLSRTYGHEILVQNALENEQLKKRLFILYIQCTNWSSQCSPIFISIIY